MKKRSITIVVLLVITGVAFFFYARRERPPRVRKFSLEEISSCLSPDVRWNTAFSLEELERAQSILSQPLRFLTKGTQSCVFVTEDGEYVVKFFKHSSTDIVQYKNKKNNLKPVYLKRKKKLQERLFAGYKIGFEILSKDTELLFVHLNKTEGLFNSPTLLCNSLGEQHLIILDDYEFIIQRKVRPALLVLQELLLENKVEQAQVKIDQLYTLIQKLSLLGCIDKDECWFKHENVGFSEREAVLVDLGYVVRQEQACTLSQFAQALDRFHFLQQWLDSQNLALALYCRYRQEECFREYARCLHDSH